MPKHPLSSGSLQNLYGRSYAYGPHDERGRRGGTTTRKDIQNQRAREQQRNEWDESARDIPQYAGAGEDRYQRGGNARGQNSVSLIDPRGDPFDGFEMPGQRNNGGGGEDRGEYYQRRNGPGPGYHQPPRQYPPQRYPPEYHHQPYQPSYNPPPPPTQFYEPTQTPNYAPRQRGPPQRQPNNYYEPTAEPSHETGYYEPLIEYQQRRPPPKRQQPAPQQRGMEWY